MNTDESDSFISFEQTASPSYTTIKVYNTIEDFDKIPKSPNSAKQSPIVEYPGINPNVEEQIIHDNSKYSISEASNKKSMNIESKFIKNTSFTPLQKSQLSSRDFYQNYSANDSKLFSETLTRIFRKNHKSGGSKLSNSGRHEIINSSNKHSILVKSNQIEQRTPTASISIHTPKINLSSDISRFDANSGYVIKKEHIYTNSSAQLRTQSSGIPFISSTNAKKNLSNSKSLTLGSTIGRTPRNAYAPEYIIAITENRAKEVGIATFNVTTGEIVITQISDNHTYMNTCAFIFKFFPIEILFPHTQEASLLFQIVEKNFSKTPLRLVKKFFYDETKGYLIYNQTKYKLIGDPDSKYLAFASVNALMNYLEIVKGVILFHETLKIEYHQMENFTIIDTATIQNLELLLNNKTKNIKHSMISCFQCFTLGGGRLLRSFILQPLNIKAKIEERLDSVDELIHRNENLGDLVKILKSFNQCDNIAIKFMQKFQLQNERWIKQLYLNIISLYNFLLQMDNFSMILKNYDAKLLKDCYLVTLDPKIKEIMNDIKEKLWIDSKLNMNPKAKEKIFYMVKNDSNELLDLARLYHTKLITEGLEIFTNIQKKLLSKNLKLLNQEKRGYVIFVGADVLKKYPIEDLESIIGEPLIQVVKKGQGYLIKPKSLDSVNNKLVECCNEILKQTEESLMDLLRKIQGNIDIIFSLSDAISLIDVLTAFAQYKISSNVQTTRPSFDEDISSLVIIKSKHPMLDGLKENIVSNDYFMSPNNPAILVYGPSNSGKSIYIKQLALLIIFAQIGCYVPCETGNFIIFDRIYSRIGTNDNLEINESSLSTELKQSYGILINTEDIKYRKLIIADGFAKSTSFDESLALSCGITEKLLSNQNIYVLITSNEQQIFYLKSLYKLISCVNMKSDWKDERLQHSYKAEKCKGTFFVDKEKRNIDLSNFSKEFQRIYEENLQLIGYGKEKEATLSLKEEKYNDSLKDLITSYLCWVSRIEDQEEKNKQLENLKKRYLKNL